MACTLVESYLYACPKVGYARNRSRTACFNEGFLKQAILGSKRLAGKQVDSAVCCCALVRRMHDIVSKDANLIKGTMEKN